MAPYKLTWTAILVRSAGLMTRRGGCRKDKSSTAGVVAKEEEGSSSGPSR